MTCQRPGTSRLAQAALLTAIVAAPPLLKGGQGALSGAASDSQEQRTVEHSSTSPTWFETSIRPILKAHCFHCHGEGDELEGGLDLRLRRLIVAGGFSGTAIVPGKRDESYLFQRLRDGEMPPGDDASKKLTPKQIETIGRWIDAGALTARPEPEEITSRLLITEEDRRFWSFQPVARPALPGPRSGVPGAGPDVRSPIDAFIQARHEENGLRFADDTDRTMFIRRATFDLLGLPATPEEVKAFLADESADAYEKLINRLLASPRYGERWGRHWLDVAGYADSEGYTNEDPERPHAWRYRDYVIRAFNADKPFDEFIQEQLAGDELVLRQRTTAAEPLYNNLQPHEMEQLVATGFLRTSPDGTAPGGANDALSRNQVVAETIKIVSTSLLGMTVGCAQCHHHRYDPISQDDYYAFRAIFEPAFDWKSWRRPQERLVSLYTDADRAEAARIEAEAGKLDAERTRQQQHFIQQTFETELAKLPDDIRDAARAARDSTPQERTPEQRRLLKKYPSLNVSAGSLYLYDKKAADELQRMADEAQHLRDKKPQEGFVRALTEVPGRVPETRLFYRGDHEQPKQAVDPAELTVVSLAMAEIDAAQRDGEAPAEPPAVFGSAGASPPRTAFTLPQNDPRLPTTGRRLAYARSLTNSRHPLVGRVLVNRFWLHHFGRGLVDTPGDFGALGSLPSHPRLLDWLAAEFVASAERGARSMQRLNQGIPGSTLHAPHSWSLKRLHRLIMASTVYRQGTAADPEARTIDPDGRLYAGMPLKRLEAESLRDAILSVSGKLNQKPFGPPIPIMADRVGQWIIGIENLNAGRPGPVIPLHGEEFRRSVYVQVRRSRPLAVLDTFDLPRMEPNCELRTNSTVAPQSLMLMNNDFVVEQSEHFARRVAAEAGDNPREGIRRAWRLAFAAEPDEAELAEALDFLREQTILFRKAQEAHGEAKRPAGKPEAATPERQALASFCQTLISSNRFLYVE